MLANRSMPACTVIPELAYPDVGEAVTWLCETFGFTVRWQAASHRAQVAVGGGGAFVVTELQSPVPTDLSHAMMVRVEDADTHHEHARRHGARILNPPSDYPYGERQYTAVDLAGRRWTFSQSIADVAP